MECAFCLFYFTKTVLRGICMNKDFMWGFMLKLSFHMWDDESSTPRGWYLPQHYTVRNNVDVSVWDETLQYVSETKFNTVLIDVGDGVQYERHPEISAPDAWSKDFLKKKLDEMRALGLTPIPKLNFSAGHDTWLKKYRRMVSTPEYYAVCADLINEVCEVFGSPELFHLGFDEESPEHQKNHEMIIVRNADLWWHDLNYLARECEKHGARPWVWSDYGWHHPELFFKNMSKSILQSNWYYYHFKDDISDAHKTAIHMYELLDEHGYDQVPTCSTWSNIYNSAATLGFCKNRLSEEHLKGYLTAAWTLTTAADRYALKADAERFWHGRKLFYPETL